MLNFLCRFNLEVQFIDPDGMDWYIFDEKTGMFERKEEADGPHKMLLKSIDKDGNEKYKFYDFNDPDVDAKAIENRAITRYENLSDATIDEMMEDSGVRTADCKWGYAIVQSREGSMDFGIRSTLKSNTFYIRENTAYNRGDIGNYLWGWSMAELGFGLSTAKAGAHANNALFGRGQKTEHYSFGPGTYDDPGFWDSPGDQRAIKNGFRGRNIVDWKKRLKRMKEANK